MDFPNTPADETFNGTSAADTFHIAPGTGHDLLIEQGTTAGVTDILQVDGGLSASDLAVIGVNEGSGFGLLIISISTDDAIQLQGQLTGPSAPRVELLRFGAAGSTVNLTGGIDMRGTPIDDTFWGSLSGDTYHLRAGIAHDTIVERGTTGAADVLQIDGGLTASDLAVIGVDEGSGFGLLIIDKATGDSVQLRDQLTNTSGPKVELLRFGAAGSTINLTAGIDMHGTSADETYFGSLFGDTYHIGAGVGNDRVIERGSTGGDVVQVDGGLTASDLSVIGVDDGFGRIGLQITNISTGGSIFLQDQLTDTLTPKVETLRFGPAGGTISLTAGIHMNGTGVDETIWGSLFNDVIEGKGGNDTLLGRDGHDVLIGGAGNDVMEGGAGDDTYYVDALGDLIHEEGAAGTDRVYSSITFTLGANVENLILTGTGELYGTGNALNNTIIGNNAVNVLNGRGGIDTMIGGLGDDRYFIDTLADVITEAADAGNDWVYSPVTYTLSANLENLMLQGAANIDGTGNAVNNIIYANGGTNVLRGLDGNDKLVGFNGHAQMIGGAGDDLYYVDSTSDSVTEAAGGGTDSVNSSITFTLGANVENLILSGATPINGTGNGLNNTIVGDAQSNTLDAGTGADSIWGAGGNDIILYDAADVSIAGDAGSDTLRLAGSAQALNLAAIPDSRIRDIEIVELTGTGNNSATLAVGDVLAISSTSNALRIDGNAGDQVTATDAGSWMARANQVIGANTYRTYTQGLATLLIDSDITSNL
jgi:Ca2+-binding RTX toxin-like protein